MDWVGTFEEKTETKIPCMCAFKEFFPHQDQWWASYFYKVATLLHFRY
jgi:hypothetical protein